MNPILKLLTSGRTVKDATDTELCEILELYTSLGYPCGDVFYQVESEIILRLGSKEVERSQLLSDIRGWCLPMRTDPDRA